MLGLFFFFCIEQMLCSLICLCSLHFFFVTHMVEVNIMLCYTTILSMHSHVACTFTRNYSGKLGSSICYFWTYYIYCSLRFFIFSLLGFALVQMHWETVRFISSKETNWEEMYEMGANIIKQGSVVYWTVPMMSDFFFGNKKCTQIIGNVWGSKVTNHIITKTLLWILRIFVHIPS